MISPDDAAPGLPEADPALVAQIRLNTDRYIATCCQHVPPLMHNEVRAAYIAGALSQQQAITNAMVQTHKNMTRAMRAIIDPMEFPHFNVVSKD